MSLFILSGHFWSFGAFFGHFLANFGPKLKIVVIWSCDHSKWQQEKQKSNGDGFGHHFSDIKANFGNFGPVWAIFGQFWPLTQDCCKLIMWPLNMTAKEAEIQWRRFRMFVFRLSGQFWSFGAFFSHFWPHFANLVFKLKIVYVVRNDLDVLKVTTETISIRFLLDLHSFWGVKRPVCDNFVFRSKSGS